MSLANELLDGAPSSVQQKDSLEPSESQVLRLARQIVQQDLSTGQVDKS